MSKQDNSGSDKDKRNHLKVLEFIPKDQLEEEEEELDFGDMLCDIINSDEKENPSYYKISYAKKGVVLAWDEEEDRMLAQIHNLSNFEMNYLLQRLILNIHLELPNS